MTASTTFPVEAGHVLLFARAVLDDREDYFDPSGPGRPVAPPTFTQAFMHFQPGFEMRPHAGRLAPGADRPAAGGTVLHAEQRFEYHRHPSPGDVLVVSSRPGRTWSKPGRRGGHLAFSEVVTEFRDSTGALVITSTAVGVETQRVVGDA